MDKYAGFSLSDLKLIFKALNETPHEWFDDNQWERLLDIRVELNNEIEARRTVRTPH